VGRGSAELVLHLERGRLGDGAYPGSQRFEPVHTDIAVFGALQVSATGNLANEDGRDDLGTLDFDSRGVVVMMEHTDWRGRPRIVRHCSLPLIGHACVDRIITELGVIEFEQRDGRRALVLRELAPGVSISRVVAATGAPLRIPAELVRPGSWLDQGATHG
jgi:3-oxoacid CoA-transferase B subunit